jgi:hypothetical protein
MDRILGGASQPCDATEREAATAPRRMMQEGAALYEEPREPKAVEAPTHSELKLKNKVAEGAGQKSNLLHSEAPDCFSPRRCGGWAGVNGSRRPDCSQ